MTRTQRSAERALSVVRLRADALWRDRLRLGEEAPPSELGKRLRPQASGGAKSPRSGDRERAAPRRGVNPRDGQPSLP
jgi:hypothetical protein